MNLRTLWFVMAGCSFSAGAAFTMWWITIREIMPERSWGTPLFLGMILFMFLGTIATSIFSKRFLDDSTDNH